MKVCYTLPNRDSAESAGIVTAPSALQEYLKRLDGLLDLPDFSKKVHRGTAESSDNVTNIVRQFASRDDL